jgi:hypothetical protein
MILNHFGRNVVNIGIDNDSLMTIIQDFGSQDRKDSHASTHQQTSSWFKHNLHPTISQHITQNPQIFNIFSKHRIQKMSPLSGGK